ncbi:hypothetical protein [Methylobacterium gnaphalii]|uniref:Bacteriophage tail tape measure N-terminal domain-containing protein n=1 Tax=Methylobacterium gnaphalii TaxID=1010610 RepID=A0A512JH38_9HYPH|nr:hypothetical protein [Methylobacterium gnaphalii]GEP09280.1 hypothetical protein MGN01_11250 [Methylobacterium gnaphalii]GJD69061.1 hypothetical protein MMMDOFMJ_1987 [Methylobacterium gnaphalii]GLS50987.1 hypothetical protein GCM10007885_38410 [Methylobacterium gnaphalii]
MVSVNTLRTVTVRFQSEGAEKARSDATSVATAHDLIAKATEAAASATERASQRHLQAMTAFDKQRAVLDQLVKTQQLEMTTLAQMGTASTQSAAAMTRAANQNEQAIGGVGSAFKETAKFAVEHPVLVAAGSALAARALSGYAATAATSLGAASLVTAKYAAESAAMGSSVAGAATLASRGLSAASAGATAAAGGLATYSASVGSLTTSVGLLTRGVGYVVPALAPLAIGFAVFEVGKLAVGQANEQIERFVHLGESADRGNTGVEFFQRFSEAAKDAKVGADAIEAALKTATGTVIPKFEQADPIRNHLSDLFESGYLGDRQSQGLADYRKANSAEGRIRGAVTAMQELQQAGERLAAIDLADRLFGGDVADRIRQGKLQIDAIAESLDRKRDDIITAQQVQQAAEFKERLDDAYRSIDDALRVSVSLAEAGRAINNVWLSIAESTAKAAIASSSYLDKMVAAANMSGGLQSPLTLGRETPVGSGNLAGELGAIAGTSARGRVLYPEAIGPQLPPTAILRDVPLPPRRPLDMVLSPEKYGIGVSPRGAGGDQTDTRDAYDSAVKSMEDRIRHQQQEIATFGQAADVVARYRAETELTTAAQRAGRDVTGELKTQISGLADQAAAAALKQDQLREAMRGLDDARSTAQGIFSGFGNDLARGSTFADAMTSALTRLESKLIDMATSGLVDQLFGKSGTSGTGLLGGLIGGSGGGSLFSGLGKLLGFADGGPVYGPGGPRSDNLLIRASPGEYVVNAAATSQHRGLLDHINGGGMFNRLMGFADGGLIPSPTGEFGKAGGFGEVLA